VLFCLLSFYRTKRKAFSFFAITKNVCRSMKQTLRFAFYSLTVFFALLPGMARAQQNGLNFDGTNDYASFSTSTLPDYSFECWVKFTGSSTASQTILVYTDASGPTSDWSHNLYTDANGHFEHYSYDGGLNFVTSYTVAAVNTWYHVAITGASNGYIRLYVNGVEEGTAAYVGSLWTGGDRIQIGNNSGSAGYLNGTVDEVRIWDRELCANEISANMNGELFNPGAQSGLHRYYKLNQGTACGTNTSLNSMIDLSTNAVNGSVYNLALSGSSSNWVAGASSVTGTLGASYNAVDGVSSSTGTAIVSISGSTAANNCGLIANLAPRTGTPLSGSVTAEVTLDGSTLTYNSQAYVRRHYDIEPATNSNTATATITLYYTQADFDEFNLVRGSLPSLPTSANDASNAANLRISQFHGVPSGGSAPGNYPATWGGTGPAHVLITPTSVTYNSTYGRWEVTFPVTGFSGFFASTTSVPLPVTITDFAAGLLRDADVLIRWNAVNVDRGNVFTAERSTDGQSFNAIGTVEATTPGKYALHDYAPLSGTTYYRLRTTNAAGEHTFSNVQHVYIGKRNDISISPNPAGDYLNIQSNGTEGSAMLLNMQGQEQLRADIRQGNATMDLRYLPAGLYVLRLSDGSAFRVMKK
jgi:hypothetical protein